MPPAPQRGRLPALLATTLACAVFGALAGTWIPPRFQAAPTPAPRQPGRASPALTNASPCRVPATTRLRYLHLASSVARLGCQHCHELPGMDALRSGDGPDLTGVADRLSASWLVRWIACAEDEATAETLLSPSPAGGPHDLALSREDAEAAAAYLWQQPPTDDAPLVPPADPTFHRRSLASAREDFDDPACWDCHVYSGRRYVQEFGCLNCHALDGRGGDVGPSLSRVGEKVRYPYVRRFLTNPGRTRPATRMPNLRLETGEAQCIAAYLSERVEANFPASSPGEIQEEIDQLRHPEGDEREPAAASRQAIVALTARKRTQERLLGKFRDAWQRQEDERAKVSAAAGAGTRGKQVLEAARCAACHRIRGFPEGGPARLSIAQKGKEAGSFERAHLNRETRTTGAAVQSETPAAVLRPRYVLPAQDAERVGELLRLLAQWGPAVASRSGLSATDVAVLEGRTTVDRLGCTACHEITLPTDAMPVPIALHAPQPPPAAPAVPCPTLAEEGRRVRDAWLVDFLRAPRAIRPTVQTIMPTFSLTPGELEGLVAFFRGVATGGVEAEPSPSADAPDAAAAERGRGLFAQSDCGACHYPRAASAGERSLPAPLLSGVAGRLRGEWLETWLADPERLHKGAAMPAYAFTAEECRDLAEYVLARPREIVEAEKGAQVGRSRNHHAR